MGKAPAFQFYPGDWERDLGEHPIEIEGAWIRVCCNLWWSQGTATKPVEQWSKVLRESRGKTQKILRYLLSNSIADGEEKEGAFTITSRRMIRDIHIYKVRKEAGQKGGHPALTDGYNEPGFVYVMQRLSDGFVKVGISRNPSERLYKIRFQHKGDSIELCRSYRVEDMGKIEAKLHDTFADRGQGEWFDIKPEQVDNELNLLGILLKEDFKQTVKQNLTPSSSSSTSTSKKQQKEHKDIYGSQFHRVFLTVEERKKLDTTFGNTRAAEMIENMDLYLASKGDKYKSHYATLLSWERKNGGQNGQPSGSTGTAPQKASGARNLGDGQAYPVDLEVSE